MNINLKKKNKNEITIVSKNLLNSMSYLFSYCSSLINFPDISIWSVKKLENIERMFYDFNTLILPDISKWKIPNIKNMKDFCSLSNKTEIIASSELFSSFIQDNSNYSSDCGVCNR
jgi:hypothetical protein